MVYSQGSDSRHLMTPGRPKMEEPKVAEGATLMAIGLASARRKESIAWALAVVPLAVIPV